jgi:endo-1,4-beta-D-glucanase Y
MTTICCGAWWARQVCISRRATGSAVIWRRFAAGVVPWLVAWLLLLNTGPCLAATLNPDHDLVGNLWRQYKQNYLLTDGRVVDRRLNRVTSESQAYGLLRAVWMADAEAFAKIFAWTETHLRRPDGLYGWLWQPVRQGRMVDANTATDADQDIALALILAAKSFDQPAYLQRAALLVKAIRQHTGIAVGEGWFISAGNWARSGRIINLSYFSPAAYPYFERLDPQGGWDDLRQLGYRLVARTLARTDTSLIPDFCRVTPQGDIRLLPAEAHHSNLFSFDAIRLYWRVALACRLHGAPLDCEADLGARTLLTVFRRDGKFYQAYSVEGYPRSQRSSVSFYGALLPLFETREPATAAMLRKGPLSPAKILEIAGRVDRYYDLNWIWFGLALSSGWIETRTPPPMAILTPGFEDRP